MNNQSYTNRICVIVFCFLLVCTTDNVAQENSSDQKTKVVLASEVEWEQLNPKRGDASPKAATLWGDRNGVEATGFLVKFVDGFSSPPHIHNVSYRGVVIGGLVHNDDPDAKPMWMPVGSYWTQPAGEVHITSAQGRETIAYIEIEKGPYLVLPTEQAFDRGERPVNVDPSNLVWLDGSNTTWIDQKLSSNQIKRAQIAFLWGSPQDNQLNGSQIKLPAGFKGKIVCEGPMFKAVMIKGQVKISAAADDAVKTLTPGGYIHSQGKEKHHVLLEVETDCLLYLRSQGKFQVVAGS